MFTIGNKTFDTSNHTYVMGILNVTPDSFSDGGKWNQKDIALKHVEEMLEQGMDILDIGGESTRPGHIQISEEEEIERVCPIIESVKANFDVPISLDTYKSKVAESGIKSGAGLINDIWGLKYDEKMAEVIARNNVSCCLMHNKNEAVYNSFLKDVMAELAECVELAKKANISDEKIMLDPGVGFGKNTEQNLYIIKEIGEFNKLGYPVLLGTSRKSVIGNTLKLDTSERLEGTLATTAIAVANKIGFVRVHDVKENVRLIKMLEAIYESGSDLY